MKTKKITALLLLIGAFAKAQDCKNYYYFSENTSIETKTVLTDGTFKEREVAKPTEVVVKGNEISSVYSSTKYDKNGKAGEPQIAKIKCDGSGLRISFQMPMMDDGVQPQEQFLFYPAAMKAGQQLESKVEFAINGKVKGKKMNVTFKIKDRKVVGPEKINTPMGMKDCMKIRFDLDVRFKIIGIGIPMKLEIHEWFAPGFGVVKTEAYKDGKLSETTTVTVTKNKK